MRSSEINTFLADLFTLGYIESVQTIAGNFNVMNEFVRTFIVPFFIIYVFHVNIGNN